MTCSICEAPTDVCCLHARRVGEVTILDELPIEPGSINIMDRGYTTCGACTASPPAGASFVIRERVNESYHVRESRAVDRGTGGSVQR